MIEKADEIGFSDNKNDDLRQIVTENVIIFRTLFPSGAPTNVEPF